MIPIVGSLASKLVGSIAMRVLSTPITQGLARTLMDTFSKIGSSLLGPVAQLLGRPGAAVTSILGKIATRALLPLPRQFRILEQRFSKIVQKAFNDISKAVNRWIPGGKGLLSKVMQAVDTILSRLRSAPTSNDTSTLPARFADGDGSSSGGLLDAAGKAYDRLGSIERKIQNLDPDDKNYQKNLLLLQNKMQAVQQMIAMITQLLRSKHELSMRVIGNIRA